MTSQEVVEQGLSSQPSHTSPELPTEIWSTIFDHVVHSKPFFPSSQAGVLVLSWVCGNWRNFVISMPKFWTTVHLFNNRVEMGKRERVEKLVDLCLERSKDSKLNVILTDLRRMRHWALLNLPHRFLKQSHRWETLRLEIIVGRETFQRFSLIKGRLGGLKSCTVVYKGRKGYTVVVPRPIAFFENCPQLDTLRLINPALSFGTNVSFGQLTEVDLVPDTNCLYYPSTLDESLTLLQRCPGLCRYRLVCSFSGNGYPLAKAVITHRNIRQLDLFAHCIGYPPPPDGGMILDSGGMILDFLDLPLLTGLSITAREPGTNWDHLHQSLGDFLARIQRQGAELQRLELHFPRQPYFLTNGLIHLRQTPKLQELFMLFEDTNYSGDNILEGLSESDGSYVWPAALHRLYYWKMNHNSTFAISSTLYEKSPEPRCYLQRSKIIQEKST